MGGISLARSSPLFLRVLVEFHRWNGALHGLRRSPIGMVKASRAKGDFKSPLTRFLEENVCFGECQKVGFDRGL